VRRREFIALLGGAAIRAPLAARVFVFASGLAASAWHAHLVSEAGGQGTTPVVLPQFSCCQSSPLHTRLYDDVGSAWTVKQNPCKSHSVTYKLPMLCWTSRRKLT